MIIKGLTRDQILEAVEKTNEEWGGNLELEDRSWAVKLPEPTYTVHISQDYDENGDSLGPLIFEEGWYLYYRFRVDDEVREQYGWGIPQDPWSRASHVAYDSAHFALDHIEDAMQYRLYGWRKLSDYEFEARYEGEHLNIHIWKQEVKYESDKIKPLNKKDSRHNIKLRVKSSRKPGARVSPQMHFFGAGNPRRVNAACWHLNRDFYREIFKINPDAKITTSLATYDGEDDFEENHYYAGSNVGSMIFPMSLSDNCNCDEGEYPEFATEGLTEEQYEYREWIWKDCEYSNVKIPKKEVAVTR